ncbi:DUF2490 domain-containing protein [Lutibacter sp. TH_r2]|uniref:DUF2490 domain-containing protein n=1 Tax=Lutibacter sp. TH_r2 TaxID=3082083 RepID=UPI002954C421|nr:DUF2490 domain-containing protein [Lutibacter sp. TH_r2]MDV7186362.1 DUF2490 domain-containing protein [Lutibacter sp. TH_r2]
MKNAINKHIWLTTILISFLFINNGFSQEEEDDYNDLESWTAANIKYKLNKKWAFDLEAQLRLKDDISEISQYFGELNATYSVTKKISLGGGIRYIKKNDNVGNIQGYEDHFRFHADASYKHKINNFKLKYRLRYQNKNELGVDDYDNQHFRFKTSVEYNFKNWKLDPEISGEIYNHLEKGEENGFDKYRLTIGTEYKIKNAGAIGLFYRLEKELNQTNPETTNIIGLKYSYTIKNK